MIIIDIKLIGYDTSNGIKIIKNLKKVERELNYSFVIDKVSSKDKNKYNVRVVPTLIVDGKTILSGNVMNEKDLSRIFRPIILES